MKIGDVNCNASACVDDVALMSRREHETQVMINIADEFATIEGYKLQPAKSVIINIQPNKRKQSMMDQEYILENNVMPNVKQAIHLGIIRTNTLGTDHLTCRGVWFFVSFRICFSDNTRDRNYFFLSRKARNFFSRM